MDKGFKVRIALPTDIPPIVAMLEQIARESGHAHLYDAPHTWEHVTRIVCRGVSFLAEANGQIVGVIMSSHVDIAFAQTAHLETQHFYVKPSMRRSRAAVSLLKALEEYADANGVVAIHHQMDYVSAISGVASNSDRVERLYRSRNYDGPVDEAFLCRPRLRVGLSYLYNGSTATNPGWIDGDSDT